MARLVFILAIAALNISVGFAIAAYLGRRYLHLVAQEIDSSPSLLFVSEPRAAVAPVLEPPPSTDAAAGDQSVAAASQLGPDLPGPAEAAAPPQREKTRTEIALEELRREIDRYQERVIDVDNRLRQCAQGSEAAEVEACLDALHQSNEEYLEKREAGCQGLQDSQASEGQASAVPHVLRSPMDVQTERIRSAQAAIDSFDYLGDLASACKQMAAETARLAGANHVVRDAIDEASVSAAAACQAPPPIDGSQVEDPLTGLANRAGLEAAFAQWSKQDGTGARRLCAAMLDVDQLAGINQRHGLLTGDRILQAIAQLLVSEGRRSNVSARVSGQRFAVLAPDADLRFTTSLVERIRQVIEITRFQCQAEEIRVTVSCAVVEATAGENFSAVLARAEAAIQEAKRYGRNRTFLHEGEYPTPVVPPDFGLEERSLPL